MPLDILILTTGILLSASVVAARVSERLRFPSLLVFLGVGMLAGSEGIGGIVFDSPALAQNIGTIALVLILFSGGLDTSWSHVKPVLAPGLVLATVGVLITSLIVGTAAWWLLGSYTDFQLGQQGLSWPQGLLLGAIVGSTDAAAIFALFRGSGPQPKRSLRALLELESGTNDPVAIVLTTTVVGVITLDRGGIGGALIEIAANIAIGAVVGVLGGRMGVIAAHRLLLATAGLYPILVLSVGLCTYGVATLVGGNGYLAVYVCGLVISHRLRVFRSVVLQVNDAFGWLAQIGMFLTMGLLVYPSRLLDVAPVAIAVALVLMFVARPIAVASCLLPFGYGRAETSYVAWAGLKGAVPIVLATFPATFGLGAASEIFSVVFFVVVVSVLGQGLTLVPLARMLGVTEARPDPDQPRVAGSG